jgi:hypothetical protein
MGEHTGNRIVHSDTADPIAHLPRVLGQALVDAVELWRSESSGTAQTIESSRRFLGSRQCEEVGAFAVSHESGERSLD